MTDFSDEVFSRIKEGQADTQAKLDAIVITKYISALEENRRLCNEHRESMECNILV